jgi:hypothetical protein
VLESLKKKKRLPLLLYSPPQRIYSSPEWVGENRRFYILYHQSPFSWVYHTSFSLLPRMADTTISPSLMTTPSGLSTATATTPVVAAAAAAAAISTPTPFSLKLESLRASLSPKADIVFQGSPEHKELSTRWSEYNSPSPGAVVSVACEEDVCAVVRIPPLFSPPP